MPPDYVQDRHMPTLTLAHTCCSYAPGKHKENKMVLLAKMRLSLLQILQVCVMNWKSTHSKYQGTIKKFTPCLNWWTLICVKEIQRIGEPGNKFIHSSVYPFIHLFIYPFIHSSIHLPIIHSFIWQVPDIVVFGDGKKHFLPPSSTLPLSHAIQGMK